jgi:predicted DsbA family dithiol-disulfide isomerase
MIAAKGSGGAGGESFPEDRSTQVLVVDIVSDVVCPWCYIGMRNLERALESFSGDRQIRWHPFQLNPDLSADGVDRKSYLEAKFGGPARAAEIYSRVEAAARNVGLDVRFDLIEKQPNTLAAHALIAYAHTVNDVAAMRVSEQLFRAYFVEGRFIGDIDVLTEIAERCTLNVTDARTFINDPSQLSHIAARDEDVRRQGISGVPFFALNNQRSVSGAQPPELLRQMVDEVTGE